jgi:uncharacterized membrane protein
MTGFSSDFADRDYEVKVGDYFSRGWEIFKQYAWAFILFTLVTFIIAGLLALLPSPLGVRSGSGDAMGGGNIVANILSPVLGVGYYFVAFQIARNRSYGFGDFFNGFKKFLPVFLTALVSGILIALGLVLLILPGIYLVVAYMFAQLFVVDKNLGFWSAMEASRKVITKKWFSFFGLLLLLALLNLLGLILLGVGLLVTIPLSACIVAAAYEDIVGLNSVAESTL